MNIRWANKSKTYVVIEVMGTTYQIPTDDTHPDWRNIKAMVEAGTLIIPDYEPPAPASSKI